LYRLGCSDHKRDVNVYIPILKHPESESFDVKLNQLLQSDIYLKDAIMATAPVQGEELFSIFGAKSGKTKEKTLEPVPLKCSLGIYLKL